MNKAVILLSFMRLITMILFAVITVLSQGCSWEPPHDNPVDPVHTAYQPFGSLGLNVLTRFGSNPVDSATVLFTKEGEISRLRLTDETGKIVVDELPEGVWRVIAYKDEYVGTLYGRDTVFVNIVSGSSIDTTLRLNALPYFTSVLSNAVSQEIYNNMGTRDVKRYIRLTAQVSDPDGPADIKSVNWEMADYQSGELIIEGELSFQPSPDSAYWWGEIINDSLPTGNLEDAVGQPITFIATDVIGHAATSLSYVFGVINGIPVLTPSSSGSTRPELKWDYRELYRELLYIELFNYRLRIFQSGVFPPVLVYDTLLVPGALPRNSHTVAKTLLPGFHAWEIWVIDHFRNSSRTIADVFTVHSLPQDTSNQINK